MALWAWADEDKGPRWAFVVDTDSYAGNFERELASFVVGRCDEDGDHRGGSYREMFEKEIRGRGARGHFEHEDPFGDLVVQRLVDPGDDGYGRAPMDLAPTPGYSNDGLGKVTKLKLGKDPKHAAYNSVAIFLSRKPTDKQLAILVERSRRFADLPPIKPWDHRPKILGLRLVAEYVEIVSHELPLTEGAK